MLICQREVVGKWDEALLQCGELLHELLFHALKDHIDRLSVEPGSAFLVVLVYASPLNLQTIEA